MLLYILFHHYAAEVFLGFRLLLCFFLYLYEILEIAILLSISYAFPPRIFAIIFRHITLSFLRGANALKILFYIFFLAIEMIHQLYQDANPLLFDEMIVTSKFPYELTCIFLRLELIGLVCQCLSDVLTLHYVLAIEIYFKCWACFTGTRYLLYFYYLNRTFGELMEIVQDFGVT